MGETVEIIKCEGLSGDQLASRVPQSGDLSIKWGAQLIVHETQMAIFYRDGRALDTFGPGRHTLTTGNLPLVSGILDKLTGNKPFFPAAVVFVNMTPHKVNWGTPGQIFVTSPDFGKIPVGAFGNYEVVIRDPRIFAGNLMQTRDAYSVGDLKEYMKEDLNQNIQEMLGDFIPLFGFFNISSKAKKIGSLMKFRLRKVFEGHGIEVRTFNVSRFSTDKAIEEKMVEGIAAGAATQEELSKVRGVMDVYAQKGTVDAFQKMAANPGQAGGAMGMGAGLGMGLMMPQMMANQMGVQTPGQQAQQPQQQPAAAATVACPQCHAQVPQNAKFCANCGGKVGMASCPKCHAEVPAGAKFCMGCGSPMEAPKCPKCQAELQPGAKFCLNCGEKLG